MSTNLYAIYFASGEDFERAREVVVTARIATTGLHSEAALRLEVFNWHDEELLRLVIDAGSKAGRTMLRILTALLDYEIGVERFVVCPSSQHGSPGEPDLVKRWKRGERAA